MTLDDMLFVGFNRRVTALDKWTGDTIWSWKAPDGAGYVSLLLDGGQLFVSVQGYTYCLDPATGEQLWYNPMKGKGLGVTSLATVNGHSNYDHLGGADAEQKRNSASSAT